LFILPYSVGQLALDSFSTYLGVTLSPDKSKNGFFSETKIDINGRLLDIALYKTRTFFRVVFRYPASYPAYYYEDAPMNLSGPPVSMVLRKTSHTPTSLIVLHDSLEHKPTVLSSKFGGSANGHNGIRSLISALGTKDFFRLRLGIGRPESNVADYVLTRLPNFERQFWAPDGPGLELIWEQIQRIALQVEQRSS
jgi:peptidyl-tRNA hydrolase, PTH1 family